MDIQRPFETFQESAFRLEGLPRYTVENETAAYDEFKKSGKVHTLLNPEWREFVESSVKAGKTIQRLRLLSQPLTDYEEFEIKTYPGSPVGEDIRVVSRDQFSDKYQYDFWLFDGRWVAKMNYKDNGEFIDFDIYELDSKELAGCNYWLSIFQEAQKL